MIFTIAVAKKEKREEFIAEDLKLFHEECGGGPIDTSYHLSQWNLRCKRCNVSISIRISINGTALLGRTAIDGERREVEPYASESKEKIYVIQRA